MKIGYARVSTKEQTLEIQLSKLAEAGCELFFEEKISGAVKNRPQLETMLDQLRKGDVVVITKLDRRQINSLTAAYASDKWCKRFSTFEHLVTMIYAQLSGQVSLRDLEASFNASPARRSHLSGRGVRRSTLSDANATRPSAVFEALLSLLLNDMQATPRKEVGDLVRLLDSTTLSLFAKTHKDMRYRGNNSAIKLRLLFDPDSQSPTWFQVSPARLHDSQVCAELPVKEGATYVFDRAYNNADFWADIDARGAIFVTRPISTLAYEVQHATVHRDSLVVADQTIVLARAPGRKYQKPVRRVEIFDETLGRELAFITNDFRRSAEDIAELYKRHWQIELFFKWIKQNLKIKRFLAKNPKAIRLQIITALIAYVLLKKIHKANNITVPLKRLAAVAGNHIHNLCDITRLLNPDDRVDKQNPENQFQFNFPGQ